MPSSIRLAKWLQGNELAKCVTYAQPPIRPIPGIEDKIDRDARIEGTAPSHVL